MARQIVTSNKEVIFGYHRQATMKQEEAEIDLWCRYHNPPVRKKQCGRYFFCPVCKGTAPRLPSGKSVR